MNDECLLAGCKTGFVCMLFASLHSQRHDVPLRRENAPISDLQLFNNYVDFN